MKKKLLMLMASAITVVSLGATPAMAYFSEGHLIQVVLQPTGAYEVATDLGAFTSTTAYTGPTIVGTSTIPVAGTGVFSAATWADLNVGYFVMTGFLTSPQQAWTSGPATGQVSGARKGSMFVSGAISILTKAKSIAGGTNQSTLLMSDPQSYRTRFDLNGPGQGSFSQFIRSGNSNTTLADLATVGYVDSYLYSYTSTNRVNAGVKVATIRAYADGHSDILGTASPVPIPAPVLLLGSGLMAFVGIRRKQSAA